ncbi:hypothetical protein CVT26_011860, partial [Gymnopilus dilepis]
MAIARRNLAKAKIECWGRLVCNTEGGDTVNASEIVKGSQEDLRDASYVRYELLVDKNARYRRKARYQMSHSNSHHPPPRGRRRRLSPERPPPLAPRTPSPGTPTLLTRSPTTKRPVKKGKISDNATQDAGEPADSTRPPAHQDPPAPE